jgi:hypothetical protein
MTIQPELDLESQLYALCATNNEQAAVEKIIIRLEALLRAGAFELVDEFLQNLDVTRVSAAVLLGALTITHPAKTQLNWRAQFLMRATYQLQTLLGFTRATALLENRM